jgi:hypothetical protein
MTAPTLQSILASGYAAMAMGKGDPTTVIAAAKTALANDANLEAAAVAELNRLNGISGLDKRCFASTTHRDFLRAALS